MDIYLYYRFFHQRYESHAPRVRYMEHPEYKKIRASRTLSRPAPYWAPDAIIEAGFDECGYGSIAGPVVGAAVIWPKDTSYFTAEERRVASRIRDSKKVPKRIRGLLAQFIKEHAVDWTIIARTSIDVDNTNVLVARDACFAEALERLCPKPGRLLVDGDKWDDRTGIEYHLVNKGDDKYMSIACASIIGKVWRDEYMKELAKECPDYNWGVNKGYCTRDHLEAMETHGLTKYHRMTWGPCQRILSSKRF